MYQDIQNLSEQAYAFLTSNPAGYPDGRHELGNGVYVNIMTYESKLRPNAKYEAHRDYYDIQVILEGQEVIAVEPVEVMHTFPCLAPYRQDKDVELYAENTAGTDHILRAGAYLILAPQDGHMPGVCIESPARVRKAVIKVPVR